MAVAYLGGSGLRPLMKLLSRCWPGLLSSAGLIVAGGSFLRGVLTCLASWCWLLAGGIYSLPQRSLQKAVWVFSGHGSWFHPEKMIQERKAEAALISPICYMFHRSSLFNAGGEDNRDTHVGVSITGAIIKVGYYNCMSLLDNHEKAFLSTPK